MTRWQIFSAVALRKLPELMPPKDPIHAKVQDIYYKYELAKSRLSKLELEQLEEKQIKNEDGSDFASKETVQDKLDRWAKDLADYQVGPYDHRMTLIQYLFVKQKFGSDPNEKWLLPQTEYNRKTDEHLMDTARRGLRETFNIVNGYKIVGKVPSSVYSYRYPKQIVAKTNFDGAKVFFLKAHLDGPDESVLRALGLSSDKQGQNSATATASKATQADSSSNLQNESQPSPAQLRWLTRAESENLVECKNYSRCFSQGLFHENQVDVDRVYRKASSYATAVSSTKALRA